MYQSELIHVYFLYSGTRLVYIGRSKHPLKRVLDHRGRFVQHDKKFKLVVYGPYEKWTGYVIESCEIIKRLGNKYFSATINNNYGYNEKLSVKDSGCKTIYYFDEGSKVEKVVC